MRIVYKKKRSREIIVEVVVIIRCFNVIFIPGVSLLLIFIAVETYTLVVFEAGISRLDSIFGKVFLHMLFVSVDFIIRHFIKVSLLVIEFVKSCRGGYDLSPVIVFTINSPIFFFVVIIFNLLHNVLSLTYGWERTLLGSKRVWE